MDVANGSSCQESGGSDDLPQTAEVSNVAGLNSPGSHFADFGDVPTRTIETAEASAIPSMGTTSSPRSAHEVGESGGSVHLPQDANMPSMGATDSPRSGQDGIQVGESGGSSHLHQDATLPSMDGNSSSWFAEDGFQVGESGGSADLPQTAEVSNVAGLNSPGSDFADFGDVPSRTLETAEARAIPSMGTTSSPRSAHEVGESGGSVHLPQDANMPSMGATDSPRSGQDGIQVGESGGSSHLHQDATLPSMDGNSSSWFAEDGFQVGESGGSADLPQTAEVSNVAGLNSPGSDFADFGDVPTRTIETAEASAIPSMGTTSSPRSAHEVGESGGSVHLPQDANMPSMGATDSPRSAQDGIQVGESGGSSHLHQEATLPSMDGNSSSWFAEDGFQVGESGGSADLPQTAEVSNVAGLNSPGSDFADFGDVPTRTLETAEASAIPSMGTTSSPRSAHEVGESGGSVHLPQDANMPSMGATDSPRSGQDGIQVGESGGSSHLHQDAALPSMDGNSSSWFAEDGFQVGESGGSADLPQTAEVSNVAGLNSPGSDFADFGDVPTRTIETAEASAIPSMGTTSSPRSAHEVGESGGSVHLPQDANMPSMGATDSPRSAQDGIQVGESGGSSHLHQDATLPSMDGNSSSWFAEDGFQVGESGGSADLPQTAEVSNVAGLNSPGSDFADFGDAPSRTIETAEASAIPSMGTTSSPRSAHEVGESGGSVHLPQDANMPSMGATDSPRSAQDGIQVGESGGSSHLHQDTTLPSMDGNSSSWFAEDGFQVGESGGSADLPQTAEVSNVAGLNSPGSDFADFGDVPTRTLETAEASAIPSMGTTSSPRSAHEVGESGGSVHLPQDANMPSMGATDSPRSGQDGIQVGESGGSSHLHQDAALPSMDGTSSSWFAEDGFQVGESGGSADLPQTAEVSNVAGLNSPGSDFADFGDVPTRTIETAEASAIPSMGTTSSPRSAHEVGESGGSVHLPQDANMPSMGATDSPRSGQDGIQVGESGGSSHLHQDATLPSMDGNSSSWFAEDGFQVGESGGSADLPQTAEVSNVAGLNSPGSDFADFGDVPTRTLETAEASAIPSMGTTSSLRSAHEVGESGGSVHLPQENTSQPGDVGGPPSMDASRIPITTERPRGDIGGDDRAGHPSGSGGSGGSGDRPGGYPAALALDPGGTDEVEASGDERRIPEAALPTGATEPKFEPHGHGMQNWDIVLCILDLAMMTSARIFTYIHTHTHPYIHQIYIT